MKKYMTARAFVVVCVSLALSGCNQVTLKTVVLQPNHLGSEYQTDYSQTWECDVPLPGQGLYVNGLGPEPSNSGEVPSGFTDIFNQGANPAPCNEQMQILYRGHVQFDLSQFDAPVSATLNFGVNRSIQNRQTQFPPQCVATVLGVSTGTRDDGQGPYYWDYNDDASLTPMNPCQTIIPPQYSIGVSQQVRAWTTQAVFNYGFIIAGPNLGPVGIPSDNNENVTFYNGFQLVVLYNPALNPRAPQ